MRQCGLQGVARGLPIAVVVVVVVADVVVVIYARSFIVLSIITVDPKGQSAGEDR